MTTDDYLRSTMGHASPEDHELFEKWCGPTLREFAPKNGLGRNGKPMPQGAGPHCIQWWRDVFGILGVSDEMGEGRDCNILEIGFCIGLSATIMSHLGADRIVSVDPSDHEECIGSANKLRADWGPSFTFYNQRSNQFRDGGRHFDLAFIDGDHEYQSILTDIGVCRGLGIKTMVFDDWHPHFGPHTQRAVIDAKLRVRAIIGNYALCEDDI